MKSLSIRTVHNFLVCALLSLLCESCCAQGGKSNLDAFAPIDSILRAELSDSVSSIVLSPKTVVVQRLKIDKDEIEVTDYRRLSKSEMGIACFQMAVFELSDTTAIAFGHFVPNVRYIFKSGKAQVWADVDFGLGKVYFKTDKGDIIKRFDLADKNLLKFSNTIFKNDDFLTFILNNK